MAAPMVPHMWDRVKDGLSAWMSQTAERQQAVDRADDLQTLVKQHSSSEPDPCKLRDFMVHDCDVTVSQVTELLDIAMAGAGQMVQKADKACGRIAALLHVPTPDQAASLQALQGLRESQLRHVREASDLLGEIADPEMATGRVHVLSSVHGNVTGMNEEAKQAAYAQISSDRKNRREDVTLQAAQVLAAAGAQPAQLAEVRAEEVLEAELQRQHARAVSASETVHMVLSGLHASLEQQSSQLACCNARKKEAVDKVNNERELLKMKLLELQQQEASYQDANIENEALRLKIKELQQGIKITSKNLELAKNAAPATLGACAAWQQQAMEKKELVRATVADAASKIVNREMPTVREKCLAVYTSTHLLTRLLNDKNAELADLGHKKVAMERNLQILKAKMSGAANLTEIQAKNAQQKDELREIDELIGTCTKKQDCVGKALAAAKASQGIMTSLAHEFGFEALLEPISHQAPELVAASYQDLPLSPSLHAEPHPTTPGASEALMTFPPNVMEFIERQIEERMTKMMLQMEADKLRVRRRTVNSDIGSDLGDSWCHDLGSLVPEHVSSVESAIGSSGS